MLLLNLHVVKLFEFIMLKFYFMSILDHSIIYLDVYLVV